MPLPPCTADLIAAGTHSSPSYPSNYPDLTMWCKYASAPVGQVVSYYDPMYFT